jgi:hypothetical protein
LFMGCIFTWQIPADRAVLIMIFAVSSYTMTFWEQKVTTRIHMAMLGNVEGIVTVILFYAAGAILGPSAMIETELVFGQTVIDFFWYSAICNTAITTLGPILRVRGAWSEVAEISLPLVALGLWYLAGAVHAHAVCALLMLLAPALAGRTLIARVTQRPTLGPDRFLIAAISAATIGSLILDASAAQQHFAIGVLFVYATAHVVLDFVLTVRRLGDHLRPGELLAFAVLKR